MRNDILIQEDGMDALMEKLGAVEATRFIALIRRDSVDYVKWRENHFKDKSIESIFQEASELRVRRDKAEKMEKALPRAPKKSTARRKPAAKRAVIV